MLIEYAKDSNGKLVPISKAHKGEKYYCVICKEELIIKDGAIKRKHYSHKWNHGCESSFEKYIKYVIGSQSEFYGFKILGYKIDYDTKKGYIADIILKISRNKFICIDVYKNHYEKDIYKLQDRLRDIKYIEAVFKVDVSMGYLEDFVYECIYLKNHNLGELITNPNDNIIIKKYVNDNEYCGIDLLTNYKIEWVECCL